MDERQGDGVYERLDHEPAPERTGLVERTDELIRATEDHATELAERSTAALAHLQEEMRLAERVLEAAETRRRVAEAEVKELSAKLEESERIYQERIEALTIELTSSMEQSEQAYQERIGALTEELQALQQRTLRAEGRAEKAENALERVQKTLQSILKIRTAAPPEQSASDRLRRPANRQ